MLPGKLWSRVVSPPTKTSPRARRTERQTNTHKHLVDATLNAHHAPLCSIMAVHRSIRCANPYAAQFANGLTSTSRARFQCAGDARTQNSTCTTENWKMRQPKSISQITWRNAAPPDPVEEHIGRCHRHAESSQQPRKPIGAPTKHPTTGGRDRNSSSCPMTPNHWGTTADNKHL